MAPIDLQNQRTCDSTSSSKEQENLVNKYDSNSVSVKSLVLNRFLSVTQNVTDKDLSAACKIYLEPGKIHKSDANVRRY